MGILDLIWSILGRLRPCIDVEHKGIESGGHPGYPDISEAWWVPNTTQGGGGSWYPHVGRWLSGGYEGDYFLGYVNTGNVFRIDRIGTLEAVEKAIDRDQSPWKMIDDDHRNTAHHIVDCIKRGCLLCQEA